MLIVSPRAFSFAAIRSAWGSNSSIMLGSPPLTGRSLRPVRCIPAQILLGGPSPAALEFCARKEETMPTFRPAPDLTMHYEVDDFTDPGAARRRS